MLNSIKYFTILFAAAHAVHLEATAQYHDTAQEVATTMADEVTKHELAQGAEASETLDATELTDKASASATEVLNAVIAFADLDGSKSLSGFGEAMTSAYRLSFIDHPLKDAYLSIEKEGTQDDLPTNDVLQRGLTDHFRKNPGDEGKIEGFIQALTSMPAALDTAQSIADALSKTVGSGDFTLISADIKTDVMTAFSNAGDLGTHLVALFEDKFDDQYISSFEVLRSLTQFFIANSVDQVKVDSLIDALETVALNDKKRMEDAETLAERVITAMFDAVDVGVGADGANDRLTVKEIRVADGISEEAKNQVVVDLLRVFGIKGMRDDQYFSKAAVQNHFKNHYYKHPTMQVLAYAETVIVALEGYKDAKRMKVAAAAAQTLTDAILSAVHTEKVGEVTLNEFTGLFRKVIAAGVDKVFADQLTTHVLELSHVQFEYLMSRWDQDNVFGTSPVFSNQEVLDRLIDYYMENEGTEDDAKVLIVALNDEKTRMEALVSLAKRTTNAIVEAADTDKDGEVTWDEFLLIFDRLDWRYGYEANATFRYINNTLGEQHLNSASVMKKQDILDYFTKKMLSEYCFGKGSDCSLYYEELITALNDAKKYQDARPFFLLAERTTQAIFEVADKSHEWRERKPKSIQLQGNGFIMDRSAPEFTFFDQLTNYLSDLRTQTGENPQAEYEKMEVMTAINVYLEENEGKEADAEKLTVALNDVKKESERMKTLLSSVWYLRNAIIGPFEPDNYPVWNESTGQWDYLRELSYDELSETVAVLEGDDDAQTFAKELTQYMLMKKGQDKTSTFSRSDIYAYLAEYFKDLNNEVTIEKAENLTTALKDHYELPEILARAIFRAAADMDSELTYFEFSVIAELFHSKDGAAEDTFAKEFYQNFMSGKTDPNPQDSFVSKQDVLAYLTKYFQNKDNKGKIDDAKDLIVALKEQGLGNFYLWNCRANDQRPESVYILTSISGTQYVRQTQCFRFEEINKKCNENQDLFSNWTNVNKIDESCSLSCVDEIMKETCQQ